MPSPFHSTVFLFQNISTNTYAFSHATFTTNGIGFDLLDILTTSSSANTQQHKTLHAVSAALAGRNLKKDTEETNRQKTNWKQSTRWPLVGDLAHTSLLDSKFLVVLMGTELS
jgi:hypothetical protein